MLSAAKPSSSGGPQQRHPDDRALLRRDASVTTTTTFGRTALGYATIRHPLMKPENSEEIAAVLRAAGAKLGAAMSGSAPEEALERPYGAAVACLAR